MSFQKVFARMEERLDAEAEDYGGGVRYWRGVTVFERQGHKLIVGMALSGMRGKRSCTATPRTRWGSSAVLRTVMKTLLFTIHQSAWPCDGRMIAPTF